MIGMRTQIPGREKAAHQPALAVAGWHEHGKPFDVACGDVDERFIQVLQVRREEVVALGRRSGEVGRRGDGH